MQRDASLPSIRDMYNWTRENHDYNVIKHHEGLRKNFAVNSKPTRKDHYLDQEIKLNSSPGPASNPSPIQTRATNNRSGSPAPSSSPREPPGRLTSTSSASEKTRITLPRPTTTASLVSGPKRGLS